MGETVEQFRLDAIKKHILIEFSIHQVITRYILQVFDRWSLFDELILDELGFLKKVQILEKIFKSPHSWRLKEVYTNIIFEKGNVKGIKTKNGKILSKLSLIKKLKKINQIRNHLAHRLVMDINIMDELKIFSGSIGDMNYRGTKIELENACKYAENFFHSLRLKEKIKPTYLPKEI
ncbi:MAG: hypothetical protein KJ939_03850 [Nanoarchaeota archaeon]|nr:hypothetical protein [Nanoarchaeota archaeon]